MKKFSLREYLVDHDGHYGKMDWCRECDGLTVSEVRAKGFLLEDEWLIDEDMYVPMSWEDCKKTDLRGLTREQMYDKLYPRKRGTKMIPKLLSGYLIEVVNDEGEQFYMTVGDSIQGLGVYHPSHWFPVDEFDEDLTYLGNVVIKVYGKTFNCYLLDNKTTDRALLWERDNPVVKKEEEVLELTIEELEEHYGAKVKIVKKGD